MFASRQALAFVALAAVCGAVLWSTSATRLEAQGQAPSVPRQFEGVWDYNAAESVNVVTGRPEQMPRSATQRGVGGAGRTGGAPAAPPVARGEGAGGGRGAGGAGGSGRQGELSVGLSAAMMREARDMSRDLLEVPEGFTIAVDGAAVSFTDDLERRRDYPTDGEKRKYRLGASEFGARMRLVDGQLRKEIEGAFGFKMTETYYLSQDGQRLFVIVRIVNEGRNRQPQGVNRVYDRVRTDGVNAAVSAGGDAAVRE